MEKAKIIAAAQAAAVSNPTNLTSDRIEALAGGHGMVNISIHAVANVITEDITGGAAVSIKNADARHLPVETTIEKAVKAAKQTGADGANAALITAVMMYLAGSRAQVGIPAGNRKLGATCRMAAGVDRSGVAAIPTAKMNSKISAFPAVMAISRAMLDGTLSPINGRDIPENIGGSPLYGHSALGEDIIWPAMAERGTQIGVQAMLDAMAGAGMRPDPLTAALLGSAAILEIIHSDADVPEGEGIYGRTTSVRLVGKKAVEVTGLPEKVHLYLTGQEFDTAQLVGDIGLILKDIGAPSVVGMMVLDEILAIFRENISAGNSVGPVNAPLGHQGGYAVLTMKALLEENADPDAIAKRIVKERTAVSLYPESALLGMNTVARKAHEVWPGPVTKLMIRATEPARASYIYEKASFAYDSYCAGRTVAEVVGVLEDGKLAATEEKAGAMFTEKAGVPVTVKVDELHNGARRSANLARKYWSFDGYADVTVTAGERTAVLKGVLHDVIPKVCQGQMQDVAWAVPYAAAVLGEISLAGCNILNVTVPAAVACAMGLGDPKEIAAEAEKAAYISAGIPGSRTRAADVGALAREIISYMEEELPAGNLRLDAEGTL